MRTKKPKKSLLVSAIVPTYNIKEIALECIESIVNQDYPNLEIIVIDNGTDGTHAAVKKKYPQIAVHKSSTNLGSTGGMNAGLKRAKGDYLWFIDHDNILNPDMLSQMVKLTESDPQIGVVTPKIFYWGNRDIIWSAGNSVNMITGVNYSREGKDIGQYNKVEEVDIAPANFLVKREVIDKVGFYDDVFWVSYEDADWCYRVRNAGYKVVYTPKAVCYHKIPFLDKLTGKRRWLSRAYLAARNKIIFMRKDSKYFPLFVLLYPAWFLLYTYQAIRYLNFIALWNFYKGMFAGFKWAIFDYEA